MAAANDAYVQTVTGRIPPEDVGFTLPHEHVWAKLWDFPAIAAGSYGGIHGQIHVDDEAIHESLAAYRERGGRTLVDVTLPAIGRDPERLRSAAERTGLNIVMGCGWYREPFYPPEDVIDRRSVDALAEVLIREIRDGVGETGVAPGIIGEIGVNHSWVSAQEERVHRAAARASLATGLAITTHSSWTPVGLAQLRIFEEEGVAPERVVIGHCDSVPLLDFYLTLVERGAYVEFDNIGVPCFLGRYGERLLEMMLTLIARGYAERILFSHDTWNFSQFEAFGGTGYCYLADTFLPELRRRGVGEDVIRTITVENPMRVLTVSEP